MNKRIVVMLLSSILVSGCFFGEVGSGYITKTCTKVITYDEVEVTQEKVIKSKDNKVVTITFNNTVMAEEINSVYKSIRNSYISEMNDLSSTGVVTKKDEEIENTLKVSYEFDQSIISGELKDKYDFEELTHNQLKKYEKEGYECK